MFGIKNITKKIIKKYEEMSSREAIIFAAFFSLLLSIFAEVKHLQVGDIGDVKSILVTYFPLIFLNIAPIMFVFRVGFIKKIRRNPLYAIGMILYFLLFVPLFLGIQKNMLNENMQNRTIFLIIVNTLNYIALIIGHIVLIRYVFLDIILKKRKPTGRDTIIVFMTYVSMGVSFGFFYALITMTSGTPAFSNMGLEMVEELGAVKLYMRHIYYSFITLTSVGFGDIYPTSWIAQLLTVIQSILGVFLLSFSLGIILSSESAEGSIRQNQGARFKKGLLKDIDELMEEKLSKVRSDESELAEIKKELKSLKTSINKLNKK